MKCYSSHEAQPIIPPELAHEAARGRSTSTFSHFNVSSHLPPFLKSIVMRHPDQLTYELPNETVSRLNLDYTPFHWPSSKEFPEDGGFSIAEPWEGYRQKKWYAAAQEPYDLLQKLLTPNLAARMSRRTKEGAPG